MIPGKNSLHSIGKGVTRRVSLVVVSFLLFLPVCFSAEREPILPTYRKMGTPINKSSEKEIFEWQRLPDLPEPLGVAGPYAGVSNDALIIAGGAHFRVPLFEGGEKVWTDSIYVLQKNPDDTYLWHTGYKLNRPLAYGVSVATDDSVVCIGGCDANRCYAEVFSLHWADGKIEQDCLPTMPKPCAFTSASRIGNTIYVAGGQTRPTATAAMKNFWALDLSSPQPKWQELEPWPGPARILPVAAACDGAFYLFSGCELLPDQDGKATRRYLTDAYRFEQGRGWKRIADLPQAVAAAPNPAVVYGQAHIIILGGDDGANSNRIWELKEAHPGFSRDILVYHTITDTWTKMGTLPAAHVITPAVQWDNSIIIPSGEILPGTRSPEIYQGIPEESKRGFAILDYSVLAAYFLVLIGMGFYFSKREKTTDDFFRAGRRIPWWAAGISIFGTQLSAITFMAIPAKAYATDWVYFIANMCIVLTAPFVIFLYLPIWRRLDVTTAYEYLEKRFNVIVRLFGSTAYILLQLGRMAIVIFLPAIALSTVTGISIYVGILLMGLLSTFYTVLGGIEAVIWSDVLQVVVLLGGAVLSLFIIASNVDGGFAGIISTGVANNRFHMFNWTWDWTTTAVWVVVVGYFFNQIVPYTADQTVIQRYLTTKTQKQAAKSIWTNAVLTVPASLIFFGLGTALFVFYKANPGSLEPSLQTDAIFPFFIVQQLPVGISGLLIAGIFAAAMSSLDSSLNSVATAIVTDFYRRFKTGVSDQACLNLARWLTVILGVVATTIGLLMATYEIKSLWDLFIKIIGLFGGSLAGLFALGIFTRRSHSTGALIGALTSVIVLFLVQRYSHVNFFLYGAIGFTVCLLVGYLASLVIPVKKRIPEGMTIYRHRGKND